MTGRKYTPQEIVILTAHNKKNQSVIFSESDLTELAAGTARLKVQSHADKAIADYKRYWQLSPSRSEAVGLFMTRQEWNEKHGELSNALLFLTKALIKKGLITEAEITLVAHEEIAGTWTHMCGSCEYDVISCAVEEKKFKKAGNVFNDLTGDLADRVVECNKFKMRTEPVKTEDVKKEGTEECQ